MTKITNLFEDADLEAHKGQDLIEYALMAASPPSPPLCQRCHQHQHHLHQDFDRVVHAAAVQ
jgi:hypothetical protein